MRKKSVLAVLALIVISLPRVFPQSNDAGEDFFFNAGVLDYGDSRKHYVTAIGGMLFADAFVQLADKYIARLDWADITFDTLKRNLTTPPTFDADLSLTNFIGHPYQGSLSYLMGRNSGLGVLGSFLLSVAGSTLWEYFGEQSLPSLNDLIVTPIGGFALGEMLYRLSLEAQGRGHTVLSFVSNLPRLFTDPVLGHGPQGVYGMLEELSIRAGFGIAFGHTAWGAHLENSQNDLYPFYGRFGWHALYGDPYDNDSNTPYSQFEFQMDIAAGIGSGHGTVRPGSNTLTWVGENLMYNADIFSDGTIISRNVGTRENVDTTLSLSMSYDVMVHSFMEFASLAPSFAAKQRVSFEGGGALSWQAHAGAIIMGAQDFYFTKRGMYTPDAGEDGEARSYGFTTGAALLGKVRYTFPRGIMLGAVLRGYAMYSFPSAREKSEIYNDTGWALFALTTLSAEFPVTSKIYVGLSDDFYIKCPFYKGSLSGYPSGQSAFQVFNDFSVYIRYCFI